MAIGTPLSDAAKKALVLLVKRIWDLKSDESTAKCQWKIESLFGKTPHWINLQVVTEEHLRLGERGNDVTFGVFTFTTGAVFIAALRLLTPLTPICAKCGHFQIDEVNGRLVVCQSACPVCHESKSIPIEEDQTLDLQLHLAGWDAHQSVQTGMGMMSTQLQRLIATHWQDRKDYYRLSEAMSLDPRQMPLNADQPLDIVVGVFRVFRNLPGFNWMNVFRWMLIEKPELRQEVQPFLVPKRS